MSETALICYGIAELVPLLATLFSFAYGIKNFFKKGGEIDEEGTCILIDPRKAHKEWRKAIVKLANNPEYIEMLQKNLHNAVKDKYNIENVTKTRAEWYKSIIKK